MSRALNTSKTADNPVRNVGEDLSTNFNKNKQSRSFTRASQINNEQNFPQNHCNHPHNDDMKEKKSAFLKKNSRQFLASSRSTNKIKYRQTEKNKDKDKPQIRCSNQVKDYDQKKDNDKPKEDLDRVKYTKNEKCKSTQRQNLNRSMSMSSQIIITPRTLPIKNQYTNTRALNKNSIKTQTQSAQLQPSQNDDSLEVRKYLGQPAGTLGQQKKQKISSFINIPPQNNKMEHSSIVYHSLNNSQRIKNVSTSIPNQSTIKSLSYNNYLDINLTAVSKPTKISYLEPQQIQICPELLYLFRTEFLVNEIIGEAFSLRMYSKGRKQIKYEDGTVQVFYNNVSQIKLTRWVSGDFKLVDGDKVSYWSEEVSDLDQYFLV